MKNVFYLLIFFPFLAKTQSNFLAYKVNGSASYRENNKTVQLKTGKTLPSTKVLTVTKGSAIVLICENVNNTIALGAGVHNLNRYTDSCKRKGHSLTTSYLKYVWWQLTNPKSHEDERSQVAGVGGGVSRGCGDIESKTLPDTLCYYKENINLHWKTTGTHSKIEFVVFEYQNSAAPLITIPLPGNEFSFDQLKGKLEKSTEYYWNIRLDDKESCSRKLLQVWADEDMEKFLADINKNTISESDKAEENYMIGFFMERNHFYGEAFKYYNDALLATPGDTRYKNTVERYKETWWLR